MFKGRIILVGSTPHEEHEETYGGTTVLMKGLIDFCKERKIRFSFIQANKSLGFLSSLRNLIYIFYRLVSEFSHGDIVMVNVASRGAFYVAPLVICCARLCRKKCVFRMFGGNFIELLEQRTSLEQYILRHTVFKSDVLLFETKRIIEYLKTSGWTEERPLVWFPNVRKSIVLDCPVKTYRKRFVFISHIKQSKGIMEILNASLKLSTSYVIDIYGPIMDDSISSELFDQYNVNYKGSLKSEDVITRLSTYDVLLLPTFHPGEGYPGIIIEALSLGIPIISTIWGSIPEVIDQMKEGILIPIRDEVALSEAILFFDSTNYMDFSKNARLRFNQFDQEKVYKDFFSMLSSISSTG